MYRELLGLRNSIMNKFRYFPAYTRNDGIGKAETKNEMLSPKLQMNASQAGPTRGGFRGLGGPEELRSSCSVLDQHFFHPCPLCVPDLGQKNGTKFE